MVKYNLYLQTEALEDISELDIEVKPFFALNHQLLDYEVIGEKG